MTALLAFEPLSVSRPVLLPVASDIADSELSLDDLGSRIVGLAGRISAATCRWLLLIAEFDRREGFARFGLPSTARWLSFSCGLSRRTAVEHVRVARALAAFPALAQAMTSGTLSFSHARAISRLAHDGETALVDELIEFAQHATIAQVEDTVRGLRTVEANERDLESAQNGDEVAESRPEAFFSHSWTAQSQWSAHARLDPEDGAMVQGVVERFAAARQVSPAEALVLMAQTALAVLNDTTPARTLRGDERAAIVVHVDAALLPAEDDARAVADDTLPRSTERGRPAGRIENGPGLGSAAITRLMCMGRIRTVVRDGSGGSPLDLGRSQRLVSKKQFAALLLRDGGHCTHPGCGSRAKLEAHHVHHWLYGGRTDLANLVLLCERHHHAHHDGEFTIVATAGGSFEFRRHDGRLLEAHIDPARLDTQHAPVEADYATLPDDAAPGHWVGVHLDLDYAVSVFAEHRNRESSTRDGATNPRPVAPVQCGGDPLERRWPAQKALARTSG